MSKSSPANKEKRRRFPDGFRILQGKQEFITYVEHSSIRIWPSDAECAYEAHFHSAIEIILTVQGDVEYELPDTTYHVTEGQILIVPQDCIHAMQHRDGTQRYLFLFEPHIFNNLRDMALLAPLMGAPIYLTDESPLHREIRELLMQVVDMYFDRRPMWNSMCYSLLVRLYALLGRQWLADNGMEQEDPSRRSIDSEIMNSVINYINQHYAGDLGLDEVASFAGFSKYYFSRAFKKFFNVSFSEYLSRRRLEAAVDLLIHTNLPIRRIAEESGFGSVASFNRVFRGAHACTPSRYRSIYGDS